MDDCAVPWGFGECGMRWPKPRAQSTRAYPAAGLTLVPWVLPSERLLGGGQSQRPHHGTGLLVSLACWRRLFLEPCRRQSRPVARDLRGLMMGWLCCCKSPWRKLGRRGVALMHGGNEAGFGTVIVALAFAILSRTDQARKETCSTGYGYWGQPP